MGWRVEEKGNKFRLWSTFSDTYITKWLTRKKLLAALNDAYVLRAKEKVIKEYYAFPEGWTTKSGIWLGNDAGYAAYRAWEIKLKSKDYVKAVDEKYECIIKELTEEKTDEH